MQIVHEDCVAISIRPCVAEIDHCATVRVPAARFVFSGGSDSVIHAAFPYEMQMIGDRGNAFVGKTTRFPIAPWFVMCSLNHMVEVRIDTVANEALPVIVPVDAPGIRRAVCEWFPNMTDRVIAIDAAVEADAFGIGRSGFADLRPVRTTVRSVQPAVWSPRKRVRQIVRVSVIPKTVKQQHRFAVGLVVAILVWNEIQVRRRHHPRSAEAYFNPCDVVESLKKHAAFVKPAIPVGILKNDDSVTRPIAMIRVVVGFRHPQPTTIIDAEPDRLLHVRFTSEQRDPEPLRHHHRLRRLVRGKRCQSSWLLSGERVCCDRNESAQHNCDQSLV